MAMEKAVESNLAEFVGQAVVTAFADTSDKGTQMGIYSAAFNSSAARGGQCSSLVAVLKSVHSVTHVIDAYFETGSFAVVSECWIVRFGADHCNARCAWSRHTLKPALPQL
jgi:hypothetical protein